MNESKLILIVDDEPDLTEILAFDLENAGYKTIMAYSGNDAVSVIMSQKVDGIISDVRMPNGDGVFLLKKLKSLDRENPFLIFISAQADMELDELFDLGAAAIIAKPSKPSVLATAISRYLLRPNERWSEEIAATTTRKEIVLSCSNLNVGGSIPYVTVGLGGAFFHINTKDSPKPNELISFHLTFTDGPMRLLQGIAKVQWSRSEGGTLPAGIGAEFLYLNEGSRKDYIKYRNHLTSPAFIPRS